MTAVALLSGGLDSMVAAAHAARHGGLALAITIDYDQRAVRREVEAATAIAGHLHVEHRVVKLPFMKDVITPGLARSGNGPPAVEGAGLDDAEENRSRAVAVWVPNRNGLFIQVAACMAESMGAEQVVVGFNREEAATFPDNRIEYLEACTKALAFTLGQPVTVVSPTAALDKAGIVRMGLELGAPFDLLWSCYNDGPRHCFRCESCVRLKRALEAENLWTTLGPKLGDS